MLNVLIIDTVDAIMIKIVHLNCMKSHGFQKVIVLKIYLIWESKRTLVKVLMMQIMLKLTKIVLVWIIFLTKHYQKRFFPIIPRFTQIQNVPIRKIVVECQLKKLIIKVSVLIVKNIIAMIMDQHLDIFIRMKPV